MIMDIYYRIEFFSNWHCGSGLAAGADVDALVVKDSDGLPYIPGRTLKGLLREAASELSNDSDLLRKIFGIPAKSEKNEKEKDEKEKDSVIRGEKRIGEAFFGNATLTDGPTIIAAKLTHHLFQTFASTAIDENTGIAKDSSLRKIETVVPCTLDGQIKNLPDEGRELIEQAMQMVKRIGTGRNRGYGRCFVSVIEG